MALNLNPLLYPDWQIGGIPAPDEGSIDVWRARLDLPDSTLARLADTLSPDERARADRFKYPADRRRFVAARGIARTILGDCANIDATSIRFGYGEQGKPFLAENAGRVVFNIAHSGDLALYAVTVGQPVGIDVEAVQDFTGLMDVAQRILSGDEYEALAKLATAERVAAFFSLWTRKEAATKASGLGLSADLKRLYIQPDGSVQDDDRRWIVVEMAPAPGFCAALAVQIASGQIRFHEWQADAG